MKNTQENKHSQGPSYALHRLAQYGLTDSDGFSAAKNGNIVISYCDITGKRIEYDARHNSKKKAPDVFRTKYFFRERISPENMKADGITHKYKSPSKRKTGEGYGHLPFYTRPIISAYRKKKRLDVVGFTEGEMKAAWVSKHANIPFIGFQGISVYNIAPEISHFLTTCRPKKIIINHDADAREHKGSNPYNRLRSFRASVAKFAGGLLTLISMFKLDTKVYYCIPNEKQEYKGIDDLFMGSNRTYQKRIKKALLSTTDSEFFQYVELTPRDYNSQLAMFFGLSLSHKYQDGIELDGNKYKRFSTLLDETGMGLLGKRWIVPTGFGKTYAVAHSQESNRKIMVVPTIALLKDVCSSYGAIGFYGGNKDDAADLADQPFICTTYASFDTLCNTLPYVQDYDVFIDEAHNLSSSTSYGFQLPQLTQVVDGLPKVKSYTLLTGTDLYNTHPLLDLPKIRVKATKDYDKKFQLVRVKDPLKAASMAVDKAIEKGHFPIVLLNDKHLKLGKLKMLLGDKEICCINAKSKKGQAFHDITQENKLPSCDVLVTTSVLKEGNSILDELDYEIIVVGNFHASDIEQMAARPRKPKSVVVTQIKSKDSAQDKKAFCNTVKYARMLIRQAKVLVLNYNMEGSDSPNFASELLLRRQLSDTHIKRGEDGSFEIDYLAINQEIYNRERIVQNLNPNALYAEMRGFGFDVLPELSLDIDCTEKEKQLTEREKKRLSEEKKAEYNELLDKLRNGEITTFDCEDKANGSDYLNQTETETFFYEAVSSMSRFYYRESLIAKCAEIGPSKNKLSVTKRQIVIQTLRYDKEFMDSGRPMATFIQDIYKSFKKGYQATSEEMKAKLLELLGKDQTINLKKYEGERNTRAMRVLRNFLEFDKVRVRVGDKLHWEYVVISHNPCQYVPAGSCSLNDQEDSKESLREQRESKVISIKKDKCFGTEIAYFDDGCYFPVDWILKKAD